SERAKMAPQEPPLELEGPFSLEDKFNACVNIIHNMPKSGPMPTTYVEMVTMYALYKQATLGPCSGSQPGFWNPEGRGKWEAWKRMGDMDQDEAMEIYVAGVLEKVDYCAEHWDWDEMMHKHAKDYDRLEPILRKNFRIIERELIKPDGTQIRPNRAPKHEDPLDEGPFTLEEKYQACEDIVSTLIKFVISKAGWIGAAAIAATLSNLPVPVTYAEGLTMNALYKQARLGPCRVSQPGFWNIIERYKWDAWHRLGEMDKHEAMRRYVGGVLEKVDYCAENWDWDEMLTTYREYYDELDPLLREKFCIIDRELVKPDGTFIREYKKTTTCATAVLSFTPDREKTKLRTAALAKGIHHADDSSSPEDPLSSSDAEYCDAIDDRSTSRSSSFSIEDPEQTSSGRVHSLKAYCARMDVELRAINTALKKFTASTELGHKSIIKLIKNSAMYISVPSRLSWRSLFFFLIWPFIVHWAIKHFKIAQSMF
ncbi:hypothetical protein PFISCL1PPCAC_569, partial [Pristionchus fissidentatus]